MTLHVKGFQKKHNERVDISILKSTNMSQMVMCKNWQFPGDSRSIQTCWQKHTVSQLQESGKTPSWQNPFATLKVAKTCRGEFYGISGYLLCYYIHCFAGFLNLSKIGVYLRISHLLVEMAPLSLWKVAWNSFEHHLGSVFVDRENHWKPCFLTSFLLQMTIFQKKNPRGGTWLPQSIRFGWFVGCLKYGIPRWWSASIPCCQAFLFVLEFHEGEGFTDASVNFGWFLLSSCVREMDDFLVDLRDTFGLLLIIFSYLPYSDNAEGLSGGLAALSCIRGILDPADMLRMVNDQPESPKKSPKWNLHPL